MCGVRGNILLAGDAFWLTKCGGQQGDLSARPQVRSTLSGEIWGFQPHMSWASEFSEVDTPIVFLLYF